LVRQKELLSENLKITNEGFQNKAAMINAYYDINNISNFTPYFGIGGGLTNVKFFGVSKITPAMQGKLGLHYNVSDKIQLSGGYRYFTSLGNSRFDEVKLEKEVPGLRIEIQKATNNEVVHTVDLPGSTTATVKSNFANHALELGLTFNF
jgi:opacity protein-like surface antigen